MSDCDKCDINKRRDFMICGLCMEESWLEHSKPIGYMQMPFNTRLPKNNINKGDMKNMREFSITVGLPCSGKSEFCEHLQSTFGFTIVNPNNIRLALHGQRFIKSAEPLVWAITETMVRALLLNNHNVILNSTNINKQLRSNWINLAKEFDLNLTAYVMDIPYEECIRKNSELSRVYESVINMMYSQYEEPDTSEGLIVIKKNLKTLNDMYGIASN